MSFSFKGLTKNNASIKNDTELDDIMAEIDNLERQLSLEERELHRPIKTAIKPQAKTEMSLQEAIDAELAEALEEVSSLVNEIETTATTTTTMTNQTTEVRVEAEIIPSNTIAENEMENVIGINDKKTTTATTTSSVESKISGEMNFSFNLTLGQIPVALQIDTTSGIKITAQDLQIFIDEEEGCVIKIKNGMNFTIPLSVEEISHKKKAA